MTAAKSSVADEAAGWKSYAPPWAETSDSSHPGRAGVEASWSLPRQLCTVTRAPASALSLATLVAAAGAFDPDMRNLELLQLPRSHVDGPDYLGVLKLCDIPQVLEAETNQAAVKVE